MCIRDRVFPPAPRAGTPPRSLPVGNRGQLQCIFLRSFARRAVDADHGRRVWIGGAPRGPSGA
eukprot:4409995-Alexandrium_andersonii.AAC.1